MIKKHLLILILFFSCRLLAQPTLSLDWMNLEPQGFAIKIKHDSQGNIIVLGNGGTSSYARITVIKYNKAGNQLWKQVYITPSSNYRDIAADIEVDSLDNIYIAGTLNYDGNGIVHNSRSVLLKYDSLGTLKWNRQYGSNIDFSIEGSANSLKIFQNKYIYLAGYIDSSSGNASSKSFLAQYDSSGVLNWTYIDSNSYKTFANDIALDKSGSSYLCGVTACCPPAQKMFVTKFDLGGNKRWNTIVSQPNHQYTYLYQALLDDSANIFLAGETVGTLTNTGIDTYVIKIDSSGVLKWENTLYKDSGSFITEGITGILFDSHKNLYVYGYSSVGIGANYFLQKINNHSGIPVWIQWSNLYGFLGGCLAKDSLLIFTGQDSASNLILYAFDSAGIIKWKYQTFCQCFANDIVESDSAFYFAGDNYEPFSSGVDSIMTCRVNIDSINGLYAIRGNNDLEPAVFFPNPFTNELKIELKHSIYSGIIRVYNIHGIRVYENPIKAMTSLLSTSLWKPGIYLIEIETDNYSIRKLISRN